jgi:hypothetical protein
LPAHREPANLTGKSASAPLFREYPMPHFDISAQVPVDTPARRLNPRGAPRAAFVSQVIADRYRLVAEGRRPIEDALRSYDAGERMTIRRLPAGFRMTLDA